MSGPTHRHSGGEPAPPTRAGPAARPGTTKRAGAASASDDPRRYRLDETALAETLAPTALAAWHGALARAVRARGAALAHGHLPRWRDALAALPPLAVTDRALDAPVVAVDGAYRAAGDGARLRTALGTLVPWRKGPFRIADVAIDCEWRSDAKWARLAPHVTPLAGRTVLDVGCGSGYHLWRMRGAGAAFALGIDPGLLFIAQFDALQRYLREPGVALLPLTLEALPAPMACFDTVFSMGVLYHRREPAAHLAGLHAALRPGGELVLETLVAPGEADAALEIDGRYARMRNVWTLPTAARTRRWLDEAGFAGARLVSVDVTDADEQRRTVWMPFDSLAEALDPLDPALTVEGYPRPRRALLIARRTDRLSSR